MLDLVSSDSYHYKGITHYIADIVLLMMISCYCFFEYKFNLYLLQQMSVSTSRLGINHVETLGRTLSGFGLALLFVKNSYNSERKSSGFVSVSSLIGQFLIVSIMCVPLSFLAQSLIVKAIVNNSNPAERRDAILAANVNSSFIPYYNEADRTVSHLVHYVISSKRFDDNRSVDYSRSKYAEQLSKKEEYYNLTRSCISTIENNQSKYIATLEPVGRAFYSLQLLQAAKSNRKELEEHITNYYRCLVEDEDAWKQIRKDLYIDDEIKATRKELRQAYSQYESNSKKYFYHIKNARRQSHKRRIDQEWRKGVENELGKGVYIRPGLNYEQFIQVKAVKNRILDKKLRFTAYDSDNEVKRKFVESLPNNILIGYDYYIERGDAYDKQQQLEAEYRNVDCDIVECPDYTYQEGALEYDDSSEYVGYDSYEKRQELEEAKVESGKQAYKAIVIPMVALVLSLFFLGTNLISIVSFIISLISKKLALGVTVCLLTLYLFYPYYTYKDIIKDEKNEEHELLSNIINWTSFYQKRVYDFHNKQEQGPK